MDQTQFLDKYRTLKSPANAELEAVLKLWLLEGKSDDEIAVALGKNRSTATRKIGDICRYFGTHTKGKKEQRQQLVFLFRKYCSEFEVHSSLYPDWVEPNSISTKPENIVSDIVPITPIASTSFDLLGRDTDRLKLAELSQKHKLVLLKAAAGIGKSTLARHFLETQFTKVIRLEMGLESGNVTPAEEKVSQILRKEFDEEPSRDFQTNLEILREKLSDKSRPIGVLIDNLEPALDANFRFLEKLRGYEDLLRILGDRDVCSFTLITSRLWLNVQRVKVHPYSLQGLDIGAWREYFHDCENAATSEDLEQMCVAYNGNAKVMDILHGAITNRFDGNIAAYWNRYKDALLADAELETLISVEMDWLRDNQPDAYKLLCRMGCYRYQDVKTVPFEGLICLLWDIAESQRTGVIDYLSKTSLIEFRGGYYLHRAVRESTRLRLKKLDDLELVNEVIAIYLKNIVKNLLPNDIYYVLTGFEMLYHYLEAKKYSPAALSIFALRDTEDGFANFGFTCIKFGLSRQIIADINTILNQKCISDLHVISGLYRIIGYAEYRSGNIHKAIKVHKTYSHLIEEYFSHNSFEKDNPHHNLIVNMYYASFANKGICYYDLRELDKCIECFKKCLSTAQQYHVSVYVEDALNLLLAETYNNSSIVLIEQLRSRLEEIYFMYSKSDTQMTSWGRMHIPLMLGNLYLSIDNPLKSIEMYKLSLTISEKSLSRQSVAVSLTCLAQAYKTLNKFESAIFNHLKSIEILLYFDASSDLAEAYFQLGLTYQAMGEHDQAETYKVKALELFEQIEAPKQIERVNQAFEQGAKP